MKVSSVYDAEFARYGRVVTGLPTESIVKALEKLPTPEQVEYVPEESSLMQAPGADACGLAMYGGLEWQMGVCSGHNRKLNCLEYHRDSEFNMGSSDFVLLVASRDDIQNGVLDTAKVRAFRVPAGVLVEVYATTLHYAPCDTGKEGFKVLIALPKGTNYPLTEAKARKGRKAEELEAGLKADETEGGFLWAVNKWLLAHEESAEAKQGAYIGLKGNNIDLSAE